MAKEKYLVVSDFRDRQALYHRGETIELDMQDQEEAIKIAKLNHAGRIGDYTQKNIKALDAETKRDKDREEMMARQAAQNSNARQPQQPARASA